MLRRKSRKEIQSKISPTFHSDVSLSLARETPPRFCVSPALRDRRIRSKRRNSAVWILKSGREKCAREIGARGKGGSRGGGRGRIVLRLCSARTGWRHKAYLYSHTCLRRVVTAFVVASVPRAIERSPRALRARARARPFNTQSARTRERAHLSRARLFWDPLSDADCVTAVICRRVAKSWKIYGARAFENTPSGSGRSGGATRATSGKN